MKIDFTIGEIEQHRMELSFDQMSGDLLILMDGSKVLQDSPILSKEPVKSYQLSIGECEKHTLAFRLTYEPQTDDLELQAMTKLRLMVTAVT